MNKPRRVFLSQISLIAGTAALCKPLASAATITKHINTLHSAKNAVTVYHTNDIQGNVDAVYKNIGGLNLIKAELKNQETGGLLLDAGNFINGSNSIAQQKQVISIMNTMGYHAATIGARELSIGQDHLASLVPLMNFTLVNCNYEFNNNLQNLVKSYIVINSGSFRIGITGVGNQLKGVKYNDAIQSANRIARLLKNEEKCDLVICLSHLGSISEDDKPDNHTLAAQSENIDMIIGSNNNKMLINSKVLHNKLKHEVILAQTAWNGLMMGRTIINFDSDKQKSEIRTRHFIPGTPHLSFTASFSDLQLTNAPLSPA
jgi:5'-nucleotidase